MRKSIFRLLILAAYGFLTTAHPALAENAFSLDLYKTLAQKNGDRNFMYSPYGISQAFQLAAYGANGDTLKQINSVLKFKKSEKKSTAAADDTLAVANRIWIQKGFEIKDSFLNECKTEQGVTPGVADFENDSTAAIQTINQWVAKQTHDNIQNLISSGGLDQATRLVIANAIYFKAKWVSPFKKNMTGPDDFIPPSGKKITTDFMNETLNANYAEDKTVQILRLLYQSTNEVQYAMTIILPKLGLGLSVIEKNLTSAQLTAWENSLAPEHVSVSLPKFTFDSSERLKDSFQQLGMSTPFQRGNADFSGIDGKKDLYLGEVFHKAFVKVDEDGTEAAAATVIGMMGGMAMRQSKPIPFTANKPFLFYVSNVKSNEIIFMGKVTNPKN